MSQGLIGGTLWGLLAAGFGLVVVSQVAPPPRGEKAPVEVEEARTDIPAVPLPATAPPAKDLAAVPAPPVPGRVEAVALPGPSPAAALPSAAPQLAGAAAPDAPPDPGKSADEATLPRIVTLDRPESQAPDAESLLTDGEGGKAAFPRAEADTEIAENVPPATEDGTATDAAEPAPGAKFVSVPAKAADPERAPRVVAEAPAAVAGAASAAASLPRLVAAQAGRSAAMAVPAVASVGPPPAAPSRPARPEAATVVVTEAPRAAILVPVAAGGGGAPAVTARAAFEPFLVIPADAPLADAPPVSGAMPPPPPLTPEELAILAPTAPEAAPEAGEPAPGVIILGEAEEPAPAKPSILKKPKPLAPTPSLNAEGSAVPAGALPRTTDAPAAEAPAETGPTFKSAPKPDTKAEAATEAAPPDTRPAIERFARAFDNAAGKPLFSIVLVDTGEPQIDREALAAMPFPVTFALDPARPESALAASIYRAAGQEVVMLATGLPEGATAADVEVSFGAHEAVLPEAVAVLDPETGGFQGDRPLATLVVPVLKGQGRGLLSWDRGLNAASQVARREGLRSGVIFRRLDGEGEPKAQIRRYLDRAAFKAAQEGRVIVAGETKPDTVAALLEWAVEGRAATVALAPLTAALRAD